MIKISTILSFLLSLYSINVFAESYDQHYSESIPKNENLKGIQAETNFLGSKIRVDNHFSPALKTRASNLKTDVITEAPGESVLYAKDCGGTIVSWLFGLQIYEQTYPADIVWDGDDVYFANIIRNAPYEGTTYVKGHVEGDKVIVPLPQTVMWYDDFMYGFNLVLLKLYSDPTEETTNTYVLDDSITSFEYIMNQDGSLTMELPGGFDGENLPEYVLGLVFTDVDPTLDGAWLGFCDIYQTYTPFNETKISMPQDLKLDNYSLVIGEYGYPVKVAIDGDNIYFQGLAQPMPEAVTKGYITDKNNSSNKYTVTIPQNEYLGIYNDETFIFTKKIYINPDFDPQDSESLYLLLAPENEGYELIYDPEANTFVPADDKSFLSFNSGKERVSFIDLLDTFEMFEQTDYNGVPQNPYDLSFDPSQVDAFGYSNFNFTIPFLATNGTLLDTNYLYYSVFIDDSELEFEEDEIEALNGYPASIYWEVTEATDELPVSFSNGWDIYKISNIEFSIGLYMEGMTTIGVQSIYKYGDTITKSAIVTLNLETGEVTENAGIESLVTNNEVIRTEYYDLTGRRIINPMKGIYVKKSYTSDGNIIVKKVFL